MRWLQASTACAAAFSAKRTIPGIERITGSSYERVTGPIDQSCWIRVTSDTKKPELHLELSNAEPRMIPGLVQRTRRLFDLDADLLWCIRACKKTSVTHPAVSNGGAT